MQAVVYLQHIDLVTPLSYFTEGASSTLLFARVADPRGRHRWLQRRRSRSCGGARDRSGLVDLRIVDVAHALTVDPDEVHVLAPKAHVLRGEDASRAHRLPRRFVKPDDADDEVDLARASVSSSFPNNGLWSSIGWNSVQLRAKVGFSDLRSRRRSKLTIRLPSWETVGSASTAWRSLR